MKITANTRLPGEDVGLPIYNEVYEAAKLSHRTDTLNVWCTVTQIVLE